MSSKEKTRQWIIRGFILLVAFSIGLVVASTNCPVC